MDLEQECDPPSFTAAQHKAKIQQVRLSTSTTSDRLMTSEQTDLLHSPLLLQLEQELTRKLDDVEGQFSSAPSFRSRVGPSEGREGAL